jgi:hypothetical protein
MTVRRQQLGQYLKVVHLLSVFFTLPATSSHLTFEAFGIGDIVHNNRRGRPAIVHRSEGTITFLTCCVPNLELDGAVFQDDGLREESGADGRFLERQGWGVKRASESVRGGMKRVLRERRATRNQTADHTP